MDIYLKNIEPCHKIEEGICTEKEKGLFIVLRWEKENKKVHTRKAVQRVY